MNQTIILLVMLSAIIAVTIIAIPHMSEMIESYRTFDVGR